MNPKVIVSLTSYPYRFKKPEMIKCLKSIVEQETEIPYRIVFNIFEGDIKEMPSELVSFVKDNDIEIYSCPQDLRSHKKYYYVMQKYSDLPIITVDDDIVYSKHLVTDLYNSYVKYSKCVSACYLYRMAFDEKDRLISSFRKWDTNYEKYEPSFRNAFGSGGGTLFPPSCIEISEKRLPEIKEYITDDELLLKKWLNDSGYPVIKCRYDWDDEEHGSKSKCGSYLEAATYATDKNSLWKSGNNVNMDIHIKNLLSGYNYKELDDSFKPSIIVTMTSWKKRIDEVIKTIESCNNQTVIPDRIYLNLSVEEFPKGNEEIPDSIVKYADTHKNFIINWVDGPNTKPFKKLFPILRFCKYNDIIITVDDDIILPNDFIQSRIEDFKNSGKPITSAISTDKVLVCKKINAGSLFTKKMFWNWEKFVNDRVIETSNDDRTYLYILYMNGFKPKMCSKYNIKSILGDMANKNEMNRLASNSNFKHGKGYDEWVKDVVMSITQKPIGRSFGFFNSGEEQVISTNSLSIQPNQEISKSVGIERVLTVRRKSSKLEQLRDDIAAGRVIKVYCGDGYVWKRVK